ncbi:MAG: hypothetical protein ABIH69_03450 [bacterium]
MVILIRQPIHTQRRTAAYVKVSPELKVTQQVKYLLSLHAASRGVYRVNIVESQGALKFTRVTCVSMTIPFELLNYVLAQGLPLSLLEQPDSINIDPHSNISGKGIILILKGAEIRQGAFFVTKPGLPIIISQRSTVACHANVPAGTVIPPGHCFPK